MSIKFYKYHGTGNDFILINNMDKSIVLSTPQVKHLCDRHFGIGADGLMLIQSEEGYDFRMVYYNSDGNESTMCGNGGRCITAFAKHLGVIENTAHFIAIDGPHTATIDNDEIVTLGMQNVSNIERSENYTVLNTGSPHYVTFIDDVNETNVASEGRNIRNKDEYQPKGINVNFASRKEEYINVRTYERGVEDETLSCGTGVTACAIASVGDTIGDFNISIHTPGGNLAVSFTKPDNNSARNVKLTGSAQYVFKGEIEI